MKIICDVSLETITVSETENSDKNLYLGFTNFNELPVFFDNLSFSLTISQNGVTKLKKSFPKTGLSYDSTDQTFVETLLLDFVKLGVVYTLRVSVINAGKAWEEEFDFILPRWIQPFESWLWNETTDCWMAPVAFPEDGKNYEWDEEEKNWVSIR
jgi:hypothetical protein